MAATISAPVLVLRWNKIRAFFKAETASPVLNIKNDAQVRVTQKTPELEAANQMAPLRAYCSVADAATWENASILVLNTGGTLCFRLTFVCLVRPSSTTGLFCLV
jgi:hypothetical protein